MKRALFALLLAFYLSQTCSGGTPQEQLAKCSDSLKGAWKTVIFGMVHDGGDHYSEGPFCMLQRLPDNKILLSTSDRGGHSEVLFLASRYLDELEAHEILWEVLAICNAAAAEKSGKERVQDLPEKQRAEIDKKLHFGISEQRVEMRVASPSGTGVFVKSFDNEKPTSEKFEKLMTKLAPAKSS